MRTGIINVTKKREGLYPAAGIRAKKNKACTSNKCDGRKRWFKILTSIDELFHGANPVYRCSECGSIL